jgi:hypothetical protein
VLSSGRIFVIKWPTITPPSGRLNCVALTMRDGIRLTPVCGYDGRIVERPFRPEASLDEFDDCSYVESALLNLEFSTE